MIKLVVPRIELKEKALQYRKEHSGIVKKSVVI